MMTRQEVFDKVALHLMTQKAVSMQSGTCLYRGPNGLKCAIGCLIPDDIYSDYMENNSVDQIVDSLSHIIDVDDDKTIDLLLVLQEVHDGEVPSTWKDSLLDICNTTYYNLKTPDCLKDQ